MGLKSWRRKICITLGTKLFVALITVIKATIFSSFIAPDGNEDRSLLGKVGGKPRRIRAKSFNLSKVPNGDKLYSNGILLPLEEVVHYIMENVKDYSKKYDSVYAAVEDESNLGVYKYEEPEFQQVGLR